MKHKTNESLIEKQASFWDEDFHDPENPATVSLDTDIVAIDDLSWNESIAGMYTDDDNRDKISSLKKALLEGVSLPPLLTDKHLHLIDGYHRLIALKELGESQVLVIRLSKKFNDTDTPMI